MDIAEEDDGYAHRAGQPIMSNQTLQLSTGVRENVQGVPMRKEFSICLDIIRFMAAVVVAISHSNVRALITELVPFSHHSRAAVIIFFILSGYVISFVASERENTPVAYWASRLSRFYLLVIPVVLATPLLDMVGKSLGPQFYEGNTTERLAWLRVLTSLSFMNEIWSISITSFSNVPFWSLCYEMWYYAMFAICAFTQGRTRVWLLAFCALLVGPKIVVLAPVWALGVVLHRWKTPERLPEAISWILFLGSFAAYALFQQRNMTEYGHALLNNMIGKYWGMQFAFSRPFITDYLLALIVAANFIGCRNIAGRFSWLLLPAERPIRWIAGLTFPLYIMHQPLLQFFGAVINGNPNTPVFYLEVVGCTLATVALLGSYAEHKRQGFKRWIKGMLQRLSARFDDSRFGHDQRLVPVTTDVARPDGTGTRRGLGAQISKFALAGGAGTLAHYVVLIALVSLGGVLPGRAAFAGASIGACVVYLLNRKFTFASQRLHRETLPRFALMAIAGAVMNGALVGALSGDGLYFLVAQAMATVVVLIFNFIVSKLWIFR